MTDVAHSVRVVPSPGKSGRLQRSEHVAIAAVFTFLVAGLLVLANIGMDVLTSMRAYVGGEGLWSKAQKDSVHYLIRYGKTHSDDDYQRYLNSIAVPLADHDARMELQKARPDFGLVRRAFIGGRNHPDDVQGMIDLFRRYHFEPHIRIAIRMWTQGDEYLQELSRLGALIHDEISSPVSDAKRVDALLAQVDAINERFPQVEDDFSRSLGDAARYARLVVFNALVAGALLALCLGLLVCYRLLRRARDADERYRHLFETASDAIVIADQESGSIVDANAKLSELTGIPTAKLVGTRQDHLFGKEIASVPGSSPLDTGEVVIRHVSGTSIPVDVRNNRGRLGNRVVEYSIVRDIRERRRFEEQIQEAARMESVGRLAGGIAHDFNNLLTVMAGQIQALKRLTTGETRERVDNISNASERAANLVRQLLAFGRKQPLRPQPLDVNQVIRSLKDMILGVLNEQIELHQELAPELSRVRADLHQLEQIILNLCTNARDAMPDGGQVLIKTWNASKEYVGLEVADTGQGMDETVLGRIFEPFFTTKSQGKGTGLGLATVYGTVKQSGGQISVRSKPGEGATFTILLPCSEDVTEALLEDEQFELANGDETILLVEDDRGVRQVLAYGLEHEGYQVLPAASGREAVSLFERHRAEIALVVTDLIMPEMGGIALGQRLRSAGAEVPVVYVTGYHQDLEKHPPDELPLFGGFLLKPFTPQQLALGVRRALTQPRSTQNRRSIQLR